MGMEGQGQPVATAHGRSVNHDYRVRLSLQGVDHRVTVVHVCVSVCVRFWAEDSHHRVRFI